MHSIRFPGETPSYRAQRNELLLAERDLKRKVEEVAALRRRMPIGAPAPEDYLFQEGAADLSDRVTSNAVRLSELFSPGKDTLVIYSFMYGPAMEHACPMCTCFLDGLNGNAIHIRERINLAVVARSPIERLRDHGRSRNWDHLRLLSSGQNHFNRDYHGDAADGSQNSIIHTFVKRDNQVHHFYSSELELIASEPGENQRHIDLMWPLWNVLDLTPEGRGKEWFPKLSYR